MNLFKLAKSYRPLAIAGFLFAVGTVAMNLGLQSTSSYLIAKAAQHPSTILFLWVPIVAVRFFGTARAGMRYGDRYFSHDVSLRWLRDLKTRLYQAIEPRSTSELRAYNTGDLLMRVGSDVDSLQNLYVGLYEPLLVGILGGFIVLGIGLLLNPPIAAGLELMLTVSGIMLSWSSAHMAKLSSERLVSLRSRLSSEFVQTLHGLTDIVALNLGTQAERDLASLHVCIQDAKRRLRRLSGFFSGLSLFVSWTGLWLVLEYGIEEVNRYQLPGILLPVVALLALASFEIINGLSAAFQEVGALKMAETRINQLMTAPDTVSHPLRHTPPQGVPALSFDRVKASLGNPLHEVLHDVTFTVTPGQHLALIGPNGSGKSTIMNLLPRLIDYHGGVITLDATDLHGWDMEVLRSQMSVVNQFPHVFRTTLKQNLLIARPTASSCELDEAIDRSGLTTLVISLPQGLDTLLGERGTSLSGGELKRLAIARAILKGAPVILLDEPTEGLDPVSEREVLRGLMSWASWRSVLWITHSLANLDLVDDVLILADGRVVDCGPRIQVVAHPVAQKLLRYAVLPS